MARRRGGRARGGRSDSFELDYKFDLFVEDVNGNEKIPNSVTFSTPFTPGDTTDDDRIGITSYVFNDAIENFTGDGFTSGDGSDSDFAFNSFVIEDPLTLDLTARYLPEGTVLTLPNGVMPVSESTFDMGLPTDGVTEEDRLEYILTGEDLEDLGITELSLIIKDADDDIGGFQNLEGNIIINEEEIDKSVSDLEFIVEQDLLDFVTDLRISGPSLGDAVVSDEFFISSGTGSFLSEPVIDLRDFDFGSLVDVNFTISRDAGFNNTIGFYEVNADGSVDPLTGSPLIAIPPEDPGYLEAALNDDNRLNFALSTANNTETTVTQTLEGGNIYAPFIVVDGTIDELTDVDPTNDPEVYFSFPEANSDGVEAIVSLGVNTIGFEDLPVGGDMDFNDIVVEYEFL